MTQTRQPQGVPSGGQFAARTHAEVDIELTGKGFALAIGDVAEGDHVQPNMYVGKVSSVGETTTVELVDRDGRPIGSVVGGPETKLSYFAGGRSASVERMAEGSLTGDEPAGGHLDRDRQ